MHLLVPPFILENFAEGNLRGEFDAASLFVDISCFSTITDELMAHGQHGAEILAGIMRPVFGALVRPVYEQGGLITGFAGDAFTALFPLEGDVSRARNAFAAAWQMQQAMGALIKHATVYGDFFVNAKVGMALGDARWGIIHSHNGQRAAYYFRGTSIDASAEAEHLAQPGEIVISAGLYESLLGSVQAEPLGEHRRVLSFSGELPEPRPVQFPRLNLENQRYFFPQTLFNLEQVGEFRQVVNLFIGLTAVRTEEQLDIFMQSVFELQDRYGGLLNRLDFGDKGVNLLLFWGAPVAYENDPQSALNFVLDLQARTSIPINAGVSSQIAMAGYVGSPLHEEYSAYGRGVNLAARFMTRATRGEIWLDTQVAGKAQSQFELESAGEMAFKGFEEKQAVFILVDRKAEVEVVDLGPLVGRALELRQLVEFVAPLWKGEHAGTLVISGEAGIGKSRLIREFQASPTLKEQGALRVTCRTDEVLRTPLGPFRTVLRVFFEQSESQSEARNKRSFNRQIDDLIDATTPLDPTLADELDRTRSFMGALLNLHWPDSLYEQLDAQGRYENTLLALTGLLRALSLQHPVVLVVEDVHWLDEDSLTYLLGFERMLVFAESRSYPIAVLLTARVEGQDESYFHGISRQEIRLSRLSEDELYQLASLQLKGRISTGLFSLIRERSGGNPFFAEQILHFIQEDRLLEAGPDGWQLAKAGQENLLPNSVRSVLVSRLDRLSPEVRRVVQTASVLGVEFELSLLFDLLPGEGQARDGERALEDVRAAEKAWIWSQVDESRFIFRHTLVREAAYFMQLRAHREAVHAQAANAIENRYASNLSLHYPELAHHSELAGRIDKARVFYTLAGDLARDNFQNGPAIADYSRALELTPAGEFDTRFMLLMSREALHDLSGMRDAQRADLESLERLQEQMGVGLIPGQHAALAARWANFRNNTGDYTGAITAAERASGLAGVEIAPEVAVLALSIWADGLYRLGRYAEAYHQAEAGLALAHRLNDRRGESRLLNLLGWIAYEYKGAAEARDYFQRSLDFARDLGDRRLEAMPLNNLGILAGSEREYETARARYEEALGISREIGSRKGEGLVLANLGWIARMQGDFPEARQYMEHSLRLARELGDLFQEVYILANLSALAFNLGDDPGAIAFAGEGLVLSRETGDRSAEAWCLIAQGSVYLKIGAIPRAYQVYQEALEIRQALGQPNLACEARAGLALASLARQDLPAALEQVEAVLAHLGSDGSLEGVEEPVWVYWTCFQTLQATGDSRAQVFLEKAYTLLEAQASRIARPDLRQSFLKEIQANQAVIDAWLAARGETSLSSSSRSVGRRDPG
jgi:predicted ATPase/class 3 adenylate cyclase